MLMFGAKPFRRLLGFLAAFGLFLSPLEPCSATLAKSLGATAGGRAPTTLGGGTPSPYGSVAPANPAPAPSPSVFNLPGLPAFSPVDESRSVEPAQPSPDARIKRDAPKRQVDMVEPRDPRSGPDVHALAQAVAPTLKQIAAPQASTGELYAGGMQLEALLRGFAWRPGRALDSSPMERAIPRDQAQGITLLAPMARSWSGKRTVRAEPVSGALAPRDALSFGGFAILGQWLPLNVWAQMLPWAAAMAVVSGVLFVDVASGGKIFYGLRQFLQRRIMRRDPDQEFDEELCGLFDFSPRSREKDYTELKSFLVQWRQASDLDKEKILIPLAAQKPGLWGQKLVAAYLAEGSPAMSESILTALQDSPLRSFHSLSQVVAKLADRRAESPFLRLIEVSGRLANLAKRLNPDEESTQRLIREVAQGPSAQPRRARRIWSAVFACSFILSLVLSMVSGYYTPRYHQSRTEAKLTVLKEFYGNDAFIFTDSYMDPRIPKGLKDILERWYLLDQTNASELRDYIAILRSSSDPRADNVLEAIFNRADHLPLTAEAEEGLLAALVERGKDAIWDHMREKVEKGEATQQMVERFIRMIRAAPRTGNEDIFQQVFYFIKSKDEGISAAAEEAVRVSLEDPDKHGERWQRLEALSARYDKDFRLQLEIEFRLLNFLNRPGEELSAADRALTGQILERVLAAAKAIDEQRAGVLARIPPGTELPPSALEKVADLLDYYLSRGQEPELLAVCREQIDKIINRLMWEGFEFRDLRERLIDARVATLNGQQRPQHKQEHLRRFQAEVNKRLKETGSGSSPAALKQREYLERAGRTLDHLLVLGQKAGIPDGGTAVEMAADDVADILASLNNLNYPGMILNYPGASPFLLNDMLRRQGFLSADGRPLPGYSLEQIRGLQKFLYEMAKEDSWPDWQGRRSLSLFEMSGVVRAVEKLDEVAKTYYAGQEDQEAQKLSETPGRFLFLLNDPDPAVRDSADKSLRDILKRPSLISAYVYYASENGAKNTAGLIWMLDFLTERLGEDPLAFNNLTSANQAWENAVSVMMAVGKSAEVGGALERGFAVARTGRSPDFAKGVLRPLAEKYIKEEIQRLIEEAEAAYPGLNSRLIQAGVRPPLPFPTSSAGAVSLFFNVYRRRQLESLLDSVRQEAEQTEKAGSAGLEPGQKQALAAVEEQISRLLKLGDDIGMPRGDTAGDRAADRLNPILYDGFRIFFGAEFVVELRARKLAPSIEYNYMGVDREKSFQSTYSKEEVRKILDFLQDLLIRDQGWSDTNHNTRPLTLEERGYLVEAIRRTQEILRDYSK